jgi:hypothetical protein
VLLLLDILENCRSCERKLFGDAGGNMAWLLQKLCKRIGVEMFDSRLQRLGLYSEHCTSIRQPLTDVKHAPNALLVHTTVSKTSVETDQVPISLEVIASSVMHKYLSKRMCSSSHSRVYSRQSWSAYRAVPRERERERDGDTLKPSGDANASAMAGASSRSSRCTCPMRCPAALSAAPAAAAHRRYIHAVPAPATSTTNAKHRPILSVSRCLSLSLSLCLSLSMWYVCLCSPLGYSAGVT